MRQDILKSYEAEFLALHPLGFQEPDLLKMAKKYKSEKMHQLALDTLGPEAFDKPDDVARSMIKIIATSPLVSMFEKPKFKDYINSRSPEDIQTLVASLYQLLHEDQEKGFNQLVDCLALGNLAKWSLITVFMYYLAPHDEVFCKPTTVKNILKTFEIQDISYQPRPSYDFYIKFRTYILQMKASTSPILGPDNAAFSGFLMMMMPGK